MKLKGSLAFALVALLLIVTSATAFAAPGPETCTKGLFQWTCTNGSEDFTVEPAPPVSGHDGNGYFKSTIYSGAGLGGNGYVQRGPGYALRFKTAQQFGAWWDAAGELHIVPAVNGTITIPTGAVMIAIPGDILGNFGLPGWVKGQHVETGEYVLGSTAWLSK